MKILLSEYDVAKAIASFYKVNETYVKGLAPEFPKFFPKYRYSLLISKGRAIIFDF